MSSNAVCVEHDIDVTREQRIIKTVSPQGDTLPDDVLIHVFVLISQDHGPVVFPIQETPPQLVLSRVCIRWHMLALRIFELWNNVYLVYRDGKRISCHEWLLRAGSSPIELSLRFANPPRDDQAAAKIIQDAVFYCKHQIKMLYIDLTFGQLKALSSLPNSILPHIEKLELRFDRSSVQESFSSAPTSLTGLRSVVLDEYASASLDLDVFLNSSLPWSQLRCLMLYFIARDPVPVFNTLRQMPLLQELHLCIQLRRSEHLAPLEELTIPSLWYICLELSTKVEHTNKILRSITCPALVELVIHDGEWSKETYEIIKQQYNLQGLEVFELSLYKHTIPASAILKDAPKLRRLEMRGSMIDNIDDEAIAGLSNGTLGRYLRELTIYHPSDINRLLSMVEMRKRTVDRLIENGCNWKEMITVLRKVVVYCKGRIGNIEHDCRYNARVDALKMVGITFD
ncbi:hypothetical protein APHAL10511_007518 [Amanita phalloides]|nr:hypothetical protein APHAL10511_007518 [Amanita phalloides]